MDKLIFKAETHEYFLDGAKIPSVTQVLKDAGIINFSNVSIEILNAACLFGIAVHKTCELYDMQNLDESSLDPNLQPYLNAWIKFRKDTKFEIKGIEKKVYSRKFRYAGTLDRVGFLFINKYSVIDIKTGFELSPATAIQTAAYDYAYQEMIGTRAHNKRYSVLLKPDGTYKVEEYKNKNDFDIFLAALSVYNFKEANK